MYCDSQCVVQSLMQDNQIIDAIEGGSFQHAKSLIKVKQTKYPQQSYYYALNAFLLFNQGNTSECLKEANALLNQCPTDPRTTDLLFQIFNHYGKEKEALQVYEGLVKKFPQNCQINLRQWFEHSLKLGNFKSLQKAGLNLTRVSDDRKYKYWCAIACYLLAESLINDTKQYQLFRSLGSRIIADLSTESTHELYVKAKMLGYQSVEIIEQFLLLKPLDLDMKVVYLEVLKSHPHKLHEYCKKLLFDEKFNDFDTWKIYISSAKDLNKDYKDIKDTIVTYQKSRNSQLALVELNKVYNIDFQKSVVDYYEAYKSKLCCYNDLVYYNADSIITTLHRLNVELIRDKDSTDSLNQLVNNQKLLFRFGDISDEYFELNYQIYNKFFPLTKNKLETDFYIANDLILINCIHDLAKLWTHKTIFKNILILQKLTIHDPLDFRVQLWLLKLYSFVNLNDNMMSVFEILKIRMLQYDSLGYLVIDNSSVRAPSQQNLKYLINVYRFYLTCEHDLQENIIKSFEEGIYNKLPNFIEFNTKLINSYQYYRTFLEIWKTIRILGDKGYETYFKGKLREIATKCIESDISDNRDHNILWKDLPFTRPILEFETSSPVKLKLDYIKELFLLDSQDHHLKLFNKLLEQHKLANFDNWLYRIYYNLFKLRTKMKQSELQSVKNYIIKNFKISKVSIPNPLDGQFNYVWLSLVELTKIVGYYVNLIDINIAEDIKKSNNMLITELSNQNYKKTQMKDLDALAVEMKAEIWNIDIDKEFIKTQFDIFHDSLVKSSYTRIKL